MVTAVALLLLLNDKCKPESLQRDGSPGRRFPQTAGCKARTCFVDFIHVTNLERLSQSTDSFSLAKPNGMAFHPVYGIKARQVWAKIMVSCGQGKQIPDKRYVGKDYTRSANERVSDRVVMQLMRPYLIKGRNVTPANDFTSVKFATQLKEKQTSLLGTVNKIRREVPLPLRKMKEELHSCKLFINLEISP